VGKVKPSRPGTRAVGGWTVFETAAIAGTDRQDACWSGLPFRIPKKLRRQESNLRQGA
jgi:hypothetical protein